MMKKIHTFDDIVEDFQDSSSKDIMENKPMSNNNSDDLKKGSTITGKCSSRQYKSTANFPTRLHFMLSELKKDGLNHVACWQPHGRSFIVNLPKHFENDILPRYFQQTKFSSFQRQLSFYGFRRINTGIDKGGYYHDLFLRGNQKLSYGIQRHFVPPRNKNSKKSDNDGEKQEKIVAVASPNKKMPDPSFHNMPFLPEDDIDDIYIESSEVKQQDNNKISNNDILDQMLLSTPTVVPSYCSLQQQNRNFLTTDFSIRPMQQQPYNSLLDAKIPSPTNVNNNILSYNSILERQNMMMETLLKLPPPERTVSHPYTVPITTNHAIPPNQFIVDKIASNNIHQLLQNTIALHRLNTSSICQGDSSFNGSKDIISPPFSFQNLEDSKLRQS